MKKLLLALALLIAPVVALAQTHTFPAEDTPNTFTAANQFLQGTQLGPVTFAGLPGAAGNGTVVMCTDCQATNPCAGSGTGALAQRQGGAWICTSSGTSTGALTLTLTNSPNCTTANEFVDLDKVNLDGNGQATAQTAALSSSHVIGVAVSGAGCSGLVQVATLQRANIICDNTISIGDWVAASSSAQGQCDDYGSTKNSAFATVGQVVEANAGAGTLGAILIGTSDQLGGSNNNGNVLPAGQFKVGYYNQPGTQPTVAGDACTTDGNGHLVCQSLATNSVGTGDILLGNGAPPGNPPSGFSSLFTDTNTNLRCTNSSGGNCIESAVLDARNFGCAQNGSTDDTACVTSMLTAAGSNQSTFLFTGISAFASNVTLPTNVAVQFGLGGGFKPANGTTTAIKGDIIASAHQQIFFNAYAGQGLVDPTTNNTALPLVYPEWWGACGGCNSTTNQQAIQAAIIGAYGSNRTNASNLWVWNRELRFSGQYSVNGTLNVYHMLGFLWSCGNRLGCGLIEVAGNTTLINGQSVAYGAFKDMAFSTTQAQTTSFPLVNIDYNGSQGTDLATQFIDFDHDNFTGSSTSAIGVEISRSGGGAQGNNIIFTDTEFQNFSQACLMFGLGNNGTPTNLATNAIELKVQNGDFQGCTGYGIANYGGGLLDINNVSFEDGFDSTVSGAGAQTGYDMYCYISVIGESCTAENVRSESLWLVSGFGWNLTNVYNVDQARVLIPGATPAVGAITQGSAAADGVYYQVTVSTSGASGLGTTASPLFASSGTATTIVDSVGGFTVNAWVGWQVSYTSGSYQYCVITSNTANTFTCSGGWLDRYENQTISNPINGTTYIVEPNWGTQTTSGGITWAALTKQDMGCVACGGNSNAGYNGVFIPGVQIAGFGGVSLASTRIDAIVFPGQGYFSYTGPYNANGFLLAAGLSGNGPGGGGGSINGNYIRKPLFYATGQTNTQGVGSSAGSSNSLSAIRGEQTQTCWLGGPSNGANNLGTDVCEGTSVGAAPNTGTWYIENSSATAGTSAGKRMTFDPNGILTTPQTFNITPKTFASYSACGAGVTVNGAFGTVTDSTTNINGATVTGGGSNAVAMYCNGTNWVVISGTGSGGGGGTGYAGTNPQTASYTAVSGDAGKLVVMNCSSACTFTLFASPGATYYVGVISIGSSVATVSLNGKNYNGAATVPVLNTGEAIEFDSDGTNYFGKPPMATSGTISLAGTTAALTYGNAVQTNTYFQMGPGASALALINSANATYLYSFVPTSTFNAGHFSLFVTTADNSGNLYGFAVYNAAGTAICSSGALTGSVAFATTGQKNIAWTSSCALVAGTRYNLGVTGNATILQVASQPPSGDIVGALQHTLVSGGTTSGGVPLSSITTPADQYNGGTEINFTFYP